MIVELRNLKPKIRFDKKVLNGLIIEQNELFTVWLEQPFNKERYLFDTESDLTLTKKDNDHKYTFYSDRLGLNKIQIISRQANGTIIKSNELVVFVVKEKEMLSSSKQLSSSNKLSSI